MQDDSRSQVGSTELLCLNCNHPIKWHYRDPRHLGHSSPIHVYSCEYPLSNNISNCGCCLLDTHFPDGRGFRTVAQQVDDPYLEILDEMRALHIKKAADYGGGTGTDNLRASAEFGIQPWIGCVLRMNDKVTRIKSFVRNGKLENESIDDSLIDIAAYAILALTLLRESRSVTE